MERESLSRTYYWVVHRAWLIFDFERWSSQRLYKWLLLRTVPPGEGMTKMYCLAPILHKFTLDCACVGSKIHFGLCLCGCSAGSCGLSPLQVNRKKPEVGGKKEASQTVGCCQLLEGRQSLCTTQGLDRREVGQRVLKWSERWLIDTQIMSFATETYNYTHICK